MKRLLLAFLLVLVLPGAAHAENAEQVAAALRSSPVYQSQGLDLVDVGALTSELQGTEPQVNLAVLPAAAAATDNEARTRAIEIGRALGDRDAVVLVITASRHLGAGTGTGAASRGVDARRALAEERKDLTGFGKEELTAFVLSFAERVKDQAKDPTAPGNDQPGGGKGAWLLLAVLALGVVGAVLVVRAGRQRKARLNESLRADVTQLYDRLGHDVLSLDAGEDPVARQALADASERYNACGAQLAQADAPSELEAARRTAIEGLTAARTARVALGLDPGPPVPLVPGSGPQLAAPSSVTVEGRSYDGSPDYEPGRPHHYGGGRVAGQDVPGGWYSGNFWAPLMLGSILTSTFGHGHGGDETDTPADAGGGDWGGSSGGDWGGGGDGGGDW